jgi:hypothetical protein
VLVGVLVDEAIDTGSTKSGRGNALALLSGPGTRRLATAEGFDSTGYYGGFGGLLPLLLGLLASAAGAARGAVTATVAVIAIAVISAIVPVTVVSAPVSWSRTRTRTRARARTTRDCADDAAETSSFCKVLDVVDYGLATLAPRSSLVLVGVVTITAIVVRGAAVVVVVVVVAAASSMGLARLVLVAVPALPVLAAAWRGKVARDVLDAVLVARAVDKVTGRGSAFSALDVGRLADILGLALLGTAMRPARAVVVAIFAHGEGGGHSERYYRSGSGLLVWAMTGSSGRSKVGWLGRSAINGANQAQNWERGCKTEHGGGLTSYTDNTVV